MNNGITLIFPESDFLLDQAVFPPLGILYLGAYLKQKHIPVQCLDFGIGHTIDDIQFDTVGISITTPQRTQAFAIARQCARMGKRVIMGGPHATHAHEDCYRNHADHVVRGYGEVGLYDTLSGHVGGHPQAVIDALPMPDRSLLPMEKYTYTIDGVPATPIMTSRGCPYACSFCAKISDTFDMRSHIFTAHEIVYLFRAYGYQAFMIFDDVFVASKKRVGKITNLVRDYGFKFRCFARTNLIDDEICAILKQMGVVEVGLGAESGSDAVLAKNMKRTTVAQNTHAVECLRKHGIRVKTFIIVGLPGETNDTLDQTAAWLRKVKPDDVDFSILQPLPGSQLFSHPERFGVTIHAGDATWYKGTPGKYQACVSYDHLSREEIVSWRDDLESEFKPKEMLR